jgi:hypothetical protein
MPNTNEEPVEVEDEDMDDCCDCGESFPNDELYGSEYDSYDRRRCSDCNSDYNAECEANSDDDNEENENEGLVHSYSYKPRASFLNSDGSSSAYCAMSTISARPELYLGFEQEVEFRGHHTHSIRDGAQKVLDAMNASGSENVVYLKEDGSISHGFEIVSHPMTIDYAMNHVNWAGITALKRMGFESWNASSCGLHIHMSRNAFADDKHLFKFVKFIYSNRVDLVKFVGRESSYAKFGLENFVSSWMDYDTGTRNQNSLMKMLKDQATNNDRYCAINIQNSHTVELRFFRPSLNVTTVQAAMQFCKASFDYTEMLTTQEVVGGNALAFMSFRKWVRNRTDKYEVLDTRITERCGAMLGEDQ